MIGWLRSAENTGNYLLKRKTKAMKNSIKYDRDTIEGCLALLVMADIRLYRDQTVFNQNSAFNFMLLCRLLKSSDPKNNDLLPAYQQIIKEYAFDDFNNAKTVELEFGAVLRVIRLINPKWKVS